MARATRYGKELYSAVQVVGSRLDYEIDGRASVAAVSALPLLCTENWSMASIGRSAGNAGDAALVDRRGIL